MGKNCSFKSSLINKIVNIKKKKKVLVVGGNYFMTHGIR